MPNPLDFVLHELGAETESGVGTAVDIGALRTCALLTLSLDDLSGTGASLSIAIETSPTGTGRWRKVDTLGPSTKPDKIVGILDRFIRATWTIGGTPPVSLAFALTGVAHVLYATPSNVKGLTLPERALANVDPCVMLEACLAGSDEADGYLGGGYTLPLTAWSNDLRRHVANIAAMMIMKHRGFQPGGSDDLIVKGQDDAISWLTKIARRLLDPPGIVDSSPTFYEGGASVVSDPSRGGDFWP